MGLSSGLHDVSGAAPLPLLLLASVASSLASLFSVVSSPGAGDVVEAAGEAHGE
jgi:E3 ubiquitin-protein ligase RHA2